MWGGAGGWRFLSGEKHSSRGSGGTDLAGFLLEAGITHLGDAGVSTVVKYERRSDIRVGILAGLT